MIQTHVYKCKPTTIQHFLNTPGRHYLLRVKSWKPCELQRATRLTLCHPFSIVLNLISMGYWFAAMYWNRHPENTNSEKYFLRQGALGSSPSWWEESPQEHTGGGGGCHSTMDQPSSVLWAQTEYLSCCITCNLPKNMNTKRRRKKNKQTKQATVDVFYTTRSAY